MNEIPESCRLDCGPRLMTEVAHSWLSEMPRQRRRAAEREAKKRGYIWLYRAIRYEKLIARARMWAEGRSR